MEVKRQIKAVPGLCRICGSSAVYSYFGAIACAPCKIFFKRNAKKGLEALKCDFNRHCEINITTRHLCSYCRLVKCFTSGMQVELIRASVPKKPSNTGTNRSIRRTLRTTESKRFPIFNLLHSDSSPLTFDQWNLISNLFHSYEEDSGLLFAEGYMCEQTLLPYKLRFKCSTMIKMIQMVLKGYSPLYNSNADFHSLSFHDRSILLRHNIRHLSNFSLNFILFKIGLMCQPTYYDALAIMIHPDIIPIARSLEQRLNMDMITMKLFLTILLFSIGSSSNIDSRLTNRREIVKIQDKYVELTWRYFLSKYNSTRAVMIFSDFIRSIFNIENMINRINDIQWYRHTIDQLIQQIEQNF